MKVISENIEGLSKKIILKEMGKKVTKVNSV
jgi:hypothetical protein